MPEDYGDLEAYIKKNLYSRLQWVIFEPNDEPLWIKIRINVKDFLHDLFRDGAFQGAIPQEAYFVKCDAETTTMNDRLSGVVNVEAGFAPKKPAEFVVVRFSLKTALPV